MTHRRERYNAARDMARAPQGLVWLFAQIRNPKMTRHHIRIICAAIRDIHPRIGF